MCFLENSLDYLKFKRRLRTQMILFHLYLISDLTSSSFDRYNISELIVHANYLHLFVSDITAYAN